MKTLLVTIFCGALAAAQAAHATDVAFSLHGERGTEGQIDGVIKGLSDVKPSDPTSISLTVTPYYGDFTPFLETFYSNEISSVGQLEIQSGQLFGAYGFQDDTSADHLNFDVAAQTFDALLNGKLIFLGADDGPSEGGFMTFDVLGAPEPDTWLLLIVGVAVAGNVLRRTRSRQQLGLAKA